MDKLDYAILNVLGERCAIGRIQALSRKQLLEEVSISGQNLFLRLKKLIAVELVAYGLKEGREHTFYITKLGITTLEEELI